MTSYSVGYAPSIRVSTSPTMPASAPLRRDAWADVVAAAVVCGMGLLCVAAWLQVVAR